MARYWLLMIVWMKLADFGEGTSGVCPSVCNCKWKGGKQTVECTSRSLYTIPEGIDSETQVLDLSENNLQIIPRETFVRSGLSNLQRVYLRRCQIGQIDETAFQGLTNLVELDLSENLLTAVPSATFRDIPSLRDLYLSNNPIYKIDAHAFRNVPGLVKLDLSKCQLQMIAPKAFEGIETLESLKLNGNRLSELHLHAIESLTRLHAIDLHENPWHCDCRLREVKRWLTHHNIPYTIPPECSGGPERIINKKFSELDLDDFACKPDILPVSRYIEGSAGENVTVVCRANAFPSPHITWFHNGKPLGNHSVVNGHQRVFIYQEGVHEKRSSLVLLNAHETDALELYCVAENRAGSAEANFTVRVYMRSVGMVTLGSGQIAGLSAALVILILFILLVISVLLVRLRRIPFSDSKTPGQVEVVTVVNGSALANGKAAISPTIPVTDAPVATAERKHPTGLNFCNPVQKPPRLNDATSNHFINGNSSIINSSPCFVSPSSGSGNNPDLINDTKILGGDETEIGGTGTLTYSVESLERPESGEYSRNADSLYPSGLWENSESGIGEFFPKPMPGLHYDDKTPIIGGGSQEELGYHQGYPSDYGLPIMESKTASETPPMPAPMNVPVNAKTLRVWQKGGVPVLPPVTALKRALSHNRNSPDEGYQEGCGTDV